MRCQSPVFVARQTHQFGRRWQVRRLGRLPATVDAGERPSRLCGFVGLVAAVHQPRVAVDDAGVEDVIPRVEERPGSEHVRQHEQRGASELVLGGGGAVESGHDHVEAVLVLFRMFGARTGSGLLQHVAVQGIARGVEDVASGVLDGVDDAHEVSSTVLPLCSRLSEIQVDDDGTGGVDAFCQVQPSAVAEGLAVGLHEVVSHRAQVVLSAAQADVAPLRVLGFVGGEQGVHGVHGCVFVIQKRNKRILCGHAQGGEVVDYGGSGGFIFAGGRCRTGGRLVALLLGVVGLAGDLPDPVGVAFAVLADALLGGVDEGGVFVAFGVVLFPVTKETLTLLEQLLPRRRWAAS